MLGEIELTTQSKKRLLKMTEELLGPSGWSIGDIVAERIFTSAQIKQLDKWIQDQNDPALDRPEAIRRLVELGLKVKK